MLQNEYFLAKIGADTAENEQHFAEFLTKTSNYPTGPRHRRPRTPWSLGELCAGPENVPCPIQSFRLLEASFGLACILRRWTISYLVVDDTRFQENKLKLNDILLCGPQPNYALRMPWVHMVWRPPRWTRSYWRRTTEYFQLLQVAYSNS